jgi:hypothetical protein
MRSVQGPGARWLGAAGFHGGEAEHFKRLDDREQVVDIQAEVVGDVGSLHPLGENLGQAGQAINGRRGQRGVGRGAPGGSGRRVNPVDSARATNMRSRLRTA